MLNFFFKTTHYFTNGQIQFEDEYVFLANNVIRYQHLNLDKRLVFNPKLKPWYTIYNYNNLSYIKKYIDSDKAFTEEEISFGRWHVEGTENELEFKRKLTLNKLEAIEFLFYKRRYSEHKYNLIAIDNSFLEGCIDDKYINNLPISFNRICGQSNENYGVIAQKSIIKVNRVVKEIAM